VLVGAQVVLLLVLRWLLHHYQPEPNGFRLDSLGELVQWGLVASLPVFVGLLARTWPGLLACAVVQAASPLVLIPSATSSRGDLDVAALLWWGPVPLAVGFIVLLERLVVAGLPHRPDRRAVRALLAAAVGLALVGTVSSLVVHSDVVPWTPHPVPPPLVPPRAVAPHLDLRATILGSDEPRTITPGEILRFTVRLSNPTDHDIRLDPCPTYRITIDGGADQTTYGRLPCEKRSHISGGTHVDFRMQAAFPPDCCGLLWVLEDTTTATLTACTRELRTHDPEGCPTT
jgi:hypothetical protein